MKVNWKERLGLQKRSTAVNLTEGPIAKSILMFALPLLVGQILQQFYNLADAWVIGNFADNNAFAAVSSAGSMIFLIVGLFNGIAMGGGVIISKYFGAKEEKNVIRAIHTDFFFGLVASALATIVGLITVPYILELMNTPAEVLPNSLSYFRIYFAGVSTIIMYNICMGIMRALGDSVRPLYYLLVSTITNVVLDLLFVAAFDWGVAGAATATVIAQGLSVVLCIVRMCRLTDYTRLDFRQLRFDKEIMGEILKQGLPSGIQNSVTSIGNLTVQANINSFGAFAMAGMGAFTKIEGFAFLPITCMSMSLPTFISQNLGAKQYGRAKKGAAFGITFSVIVAEILGVLIYFNGPALLRIFVETEESVLYGTTHTRILALFFFLLALTHCCAGVLRGCGKAFIPMITMLSFWCGVRVVYVTLILKVIPEFRMISWAYPLTWTLSSVVLLTILLRMDWTKAFQKKA